MPEESQVVFSTKFFAIEEIQSRALDQLGPYFRLVGPDSSPVCVFDHQSRVLLVKQFRPSIDDYTLEFPAGAVDKGETALEAGRRQALEETGYRIELATLGSHYHLLTRVIGKDVWRCSNEDPQSALDKLFMEPSDRDE